MSVEKAKKNELSSVGTAYRYAVPTELPLNHLLGLQTFRSYGTPVIIIRLTRKHLVTDRTFNEFYFEVLFNSASAAM